MKIKPIFCLGVAVFGAVCCSVTRASAGSSTVQVQTSNVSISQEQDGSIEINTGPTRLRTPQRSYSNRNRYRFYPYPFRHQCYSENLTQNSVTQTTSSGHGVVRSSVSTYQCN
jgi:hypothetical protein